jgi:hypothetical protein
VKKRKWNDDKQICHPWSSLSSAQHQFVLYEYMASCLTTHKQAWAQASGKFTCHQHWTWLFVCQKKKTTYTCSRCNEKHHRVFLIKIGT